MALKPSSLKVRLDALEAHLSPIGERRYVTHDGLVYYEDTTSAIDYRNGLVVDGRARRWTLGEVEMLVVRWQISTLDWSGHDARS